ncbi:protein phosphatase 1 regulatory subunit 14A [Ambystoma mexicanum]|uniref:protein phosphatase 1 regulatory subunit 14A n=1 Tax=Ambystoma mexicanum TaxID=8296 RepID=UPI0037E8E6F7
MAAQKLGKRVLGKLHSSPCRGNREPGGHGGIQKRQARVTVKYDRKELQKRLDVEKWIDEQLEALYLGRESEMPDEVNIDDLLDLGSDEERHRKLQVILKSCSSNRETFIKELLLKLTGLPKQNSLKRNGIGEHPEMEAVNEEKEYL